MKDLPALLPSEWLTERILKKKLRTNASVVINLVVERGVLQ
jgi:hypothetical protein